MEELKISDKSKNILQQFIRGLKDIYQEELLSVILYGSAASGEFADRNSNLNLLVVLGNADLNNLKKASGLINKYKFRIIRPLFLTEEYINISLDIFPIEFLDMQENRYVIYGRDILKDIRIDTVNLRFQCKHELKSKLINLRQSYARINKDKFALRDLLFRSVTSILHVLRNVLRLKGRAPSYKKEDIVNELAAEFPVDTSVWIKIISAKKRQIKIDVRDTETLFVRFVQDLEKIVDIVDKL